MRVVTFGEVMLRLAPADFLRLRQVIPGSLDATFGGGELNVAVSIAFQGGCSAFLTSAPDNAITDSLEQEIRKLGVESLVQRRDSGRFGIYYVETGANQRGSTVTYDREHSSVAECGPADYDFRKAFDSANWLHITGITPAISEPAAQAALSAVQVARELGLTVSCDLNYRKKLWRWSQQPQQELARQTMNSLMPFVDVVIANEEDCHLSLGIEAQATNVDAGQLNIAGYESVARELVRRYPQVQKVAITLRESLSASHNNWGATLFDVDTDSCHFAPLDSDGNYHPYEIRNIVDRVGAGDSFAGGLIFALNTPELNSPADAIRYAVAASCLKHSIKGDFNFSSRSEIEALIKGGGSGRVQR